MMAEELQAQRVDKFLHHVRIFKTRNLARQACEKGNVSIQGQRAKPARELRAGEIVDVVRGDLCMQIKVLMFPATRVGAPLVSQFYEDLTTDEARRAAAAVRETRRLQNPQPHETLARPNKQQLRQLRQWRESNLEH